MTRRPNPLGPIGLWTFALDDLPATEVREAAVEIEELGYGAVWFGEALGRDALVQASLLLGATSRLQVATGIANHRLRTPLSMAAAERALAEAHPDRFVLGLGGHVVSGQTAPPGFEMFPRQQGGALSSMRGYLDAMDGVPLRHPRPANPPRRVLAALGPKMLRLAAERTWGAHPYFVPVEHTARARGTLGPEAFLGVEQAVVFDTDLERARDTARAHVADYVGAAAHQRANLVRMGFTETDLASGGSDRLVDSIVAYGDESAIVRRVRDHLAAGADHVCVQVLGDDPRRTWRLLAPALTPLSAQWSGDLYSTRKA